MHQGFPVGMKARDELRTQGDAVLLNMPAGDFIEERQKEDRLMRRWASFTMLVAVKVSEYANVFLQRVRGFHCIQYTTCGSPVGRLVQLLNLAGVRFLHPAHRQRPARGYDFLSQRFFVRQACQVVRGNHLALIPHPTQPGILRELHIVQTLSELFPFQEA